MRTIVLAALALVAAPGLALAAAAPMSAPPVQGLAVDPELDGKVTVTVTRATLAAGERLAEHRQPFVRHLFVVSGKLKVSNLVSGEERLVGAGELAVEAAGDWHVAEAQEGEPVVLFLIDQQPAGTAAGL